ncbi:hypothetical protein Tco_0463659, partial [Tanacetum coccineum]
REGGREKELEEGREGDREKGRDGEREGGVGGRKRRRRTWRDGGIEAEKDGVRGKE